ncbi:hypothetical protein L950_0223205 [Sphingobacterium sp. IITKGP-BTPF85]|nr:hypothetical protein L950_0223205 [Sphingobacterium sp. IITKGP-BTPF85]
MISQIYDRFGYIIIQLIKSIFKMYGLKKIINIYIHKVRLVGIKWLSPNLFYKVMKNEGKSNLKFNVTLDHFYVS